ASFAAADPKPFDLKKTFKKAVNKVKDFVSPTINCLKKAGAPDAVLGWLKECGQTKYFGKTAMLSCAGTTYAPADVKQLAKDSANCFKMG
ncbi:Cobalamin biosynthesis protein CobD, partial [Frankliniella fusca]